MNTTEENVIRGKIRAFILSSIHIPDLADEGVEARQVLVEPEDVRDRLRERGARLRTDGPLNRLDVQLFAAGRDAHGAGAARHRQRRLECPCGELDAIRWQLCDSVRDDRAREIDWLAASAVEWKVSDASQRVEYRELQGGGAPEDEGVGTSTRRRRRGQQAHA